MIFIYVLNILCAVSSCWAQQVKANIPSEECSISPLFKSINDFGADLFGTLSEPSNVFISPVSIYTALAMVYLGTKRRTSRQMEKVLKIRGNKHSKKELNEAFKSYLHTIKNSTNDQYSLLLANGIFLQDGFNVNPDYIRNIQTFYDAVVESVDFANNGEDTKDVINAFVAENTKNKIKKFLSEPLHPSNLLILLNVIYFKGIWKMQFPPNNTIDGSFYISPFEGKPVNFMTIGNEEFRYFYDAKNDYKFLSLPYKGGNISMLIALPNFYHERPNLDMTTELLCQINANLKSTKLTAIVLPKFKLTYRQELVGVLQHLGITDLFNTNANLTGISPSRDLQVSNVFHEAVIEVNEQGSEAVGATSIFLTRSSSGRNMFFANHPFTFYIIDDKNGVILFSGRVSDPESP